MNINALLTLTLAGLFLLWGYSLQRKVKGLQKLYLPAPFIGGILASVLLLSLKELGHIPLSLDYSMLPFFVGGFFASIGLRTNREFLRKGWKGQLVFLGIVILVALLQNILSLILAKVSGNSSIETVILGSLGLMGDSSLLQVLPGMSKMGPVYLGLLNGYSVLGNILGTILGGILFVLLKKRISLEKPQIAPVAFSPYEFLKHLIIFLFTISLGLLPAQLGYGRWINPAGGSFLAGLIIRQFYEIKGKVPIQTPQVNLMGNFSLSMLLVLSFMSMDLMSLTKLNILALVTFILQAGLLMLGGYFLVFRMFRKNPLAAYVATGLIGFSLGMPASTMSSLQCIGELEGAIPLVLYIVPPVGAWLITVLNPFIIKLFL